MVSKYLLAIIMLCKAIENGGKSELNVGYNRAKLLVFSWALFTLLSQGDFTEWVKLVNASYSSYLKKPDTKYKSYIISAFEDITEIISKVGYEN